MEDLQIAALYFKEQQKPIHMGNCTSPMYLSPCVFLYVLLFLCTFCAANCFAENCTACELCPLKNIGLGLYAQLQFVQPRSNARSALQSVNRPSFILLICNINNHKNLKNRFHFKIIMVNRQSKTLLVTRWIYSIYSSLFHFQAG